MSVCVDLYQSSIFRVCDTLAIPELSFCQIKES